MVKVWINHDQVAEFPTATQWIVVEPRDVLNVYQDDAIIATIRQWQYVQLVEAVQP